MAATALSQRRASLRQGRDSVSTWILSAAITVLALADGVIHFRLDYVLFNGKLWGSPRFGRPPGGSGTPAGGPQNAVHGGTPGPPPGGHASNPVLRALDIAHITGLPLNELFLLNAIGYLVLVVVFWFVHFRMPRWRWLVDLVLIVYTVASIIGWWDAGKPNPENLGYLSKGIEAALIVALILHIGFVLRSLGARRGATVRAA